MSDEALAVHAGAPIEGVGEGASGQIRPWSVEKRAGMPVQYRDPLKGIA